MVTVNTTIHKSTDMTDQMYLSNRADGKHQVHLRFVIVLVTHPPFVFHLPLGGPLIQVLLHMKSTYNVMNK